MAYNIEQFKAHISKERGIATNNLFVVELPSLTGARRVDGTIIQGYSTESINLLCSVAQLPGRQILTQDRQIGIPLTRNAYGYAVADVNLTFYVTNTYRIRSYFEDWMACCVSNDPPYEVGYYRDYVKDVTIHQLRKGENFAFLNIDLGFDLNLPQVVQDALPTIGGVDLGDLSNGELGYSIRTQDNTVYTCDLIEAFPTTMTAIELNNGQNSLVEFTVQLSYKNWKGTTPEQQRTIADTVEDTVRDAVTGIFGT